MTVFNKYSISMFRFPLNQFDFTHKIHISIWKTKNKTERDCGLWLENGPSGNFSVKTLHSFINLRTNHLRPRDDFLKTNDFIFERGPTSLTSFDLNTMITPGKNMVIITSTYWTFLITYSVEAFYMMFFNTTKTANCWKFLSSVELTR